MPWLNCDLIPEDDQLVTVIKELLHLASHVLVEQGPFFGVFLKLSCRLVYRVG